VWGSGTAVGADPASPISHRLCGVRLPLFIVAGLCTAVGLGGCSFTRSTTPAAPKLPKGTPVAIGDIVNDLSTYATDDEPSKICSSVITTALETKLNKLGGCTKLINNGLNTASDYTLTIEGGTWSPQTAAIRVRVVVDSKHQIETLDLINQKHGGWRISSLG
jgi:hypothetical protein